MTNPRTQIGATARVRITVEVVAGSWGESCQADQIFKQAAEEGLNKVRKLIGLEAKIVGEPEVTAILMERPKP